MKEADAEVTLTAFKKPDGGLLTKKIDLVFDDEGVPRVKKDSSQCRMARGIATRIVVPFSQLATAVLLNADPDECVAMGDCGHSTVRVVPERELSANPGAIARTKSHVRYLDSNSVGCLDYDPQKGVPCLSPDKLIEILSHACPSLAAAAFWLAHSTSSHIYHREERVSDSGGIDITETLLSGSGGLKVYVLTKDGTDFPRFVRVLAKRLWLAGYGYIAVSECGSLLVRTVIDTAVGGPERLDFIAGAVLGPALVQRRPNPVFHDGLALDTRQSLPDLTDAEEARYQSLVDEAKAKLRPNAISARKRKIAAEVPKMAKAHGISANAARTCLERAYEDDELSGGFLLHFVDFGEVPVADVLADPLRYDGAELYDPAEPDYDGWKVCAKFYANDNTGLSR